MCNGVSDLNAVHGNHQPNPDNPSNIGKLKSLTGDFTVDPKLKEKFRQWGSTALRVGKVIAVVSTILLKEIAKDALLGGLVVGVLGTVAFFPIAPIAFGAGAAAGGVVGFIIALVRLFCLPSDIKFIKASGNPSEHQLLDAYENEDFLEFLKWEFSRDPT
ncbi:hypothetical protein [Paraburkholderia sediminicola]|uniref:hypothetical protein n=1 Tax=Paraburkholderia sediminicola TaxID=458836 RepID=UPI0038B9B2D6